MAAATGRVGNPGGFPTLPTTPTLLLRLFALALVDALAIFLLYQFINDQLWFLVVTIAVITLFVNIVNLAPGFEPLRWISPAFSLMILLVVYPLVYTIYVAFTNYGDGHLFTKVQAVEILSQRTYLPETDITYRWVAYQNETGQFALVLTDESNNRFWITQAEAPVPLAAEGEELPATYEGYTQLERRDLIRALTLLQDTQFGAADSPIGIASREVAGPFRQRYTFDASVNAVTDQSTGIVYRGDDTQGLFINDDDEALDVGYWVTVGPQNFLRFFNSSALAGPLINIFVWTFVFAFMSVFTTFAVGLSLAMIFNGELPGKRIIRSLLIIPYAIPAVISILIWRGLLNYELGVISIWMRDVFNWAPQWFLDPWWAKVGILLINLWLGYPYMMLVCSGALQSIPSEIYEAAEVDGATTWQRFWNLTLPLLLVAMGPLLIASFTFNFNNFGVINAYAEGGPPVSGTTTPAGYTDILISYTYNLAFGVGRGADYGYASAITIIIFVIVATLTLLQFRFTKQWEEVSENV